MLYTYQRLYMYNWVAHRIYENQNSSCRLLWKTILRSASYRKYLFCWSSLYRLHFMENLLLAFENQEWMFFNSLIVIAEQQRQKKNSPITSTLLLASHRYLPEVVLYFHIKGTLMQIWKSPYTFVFICKRYPKNFAFLILAAFELFTRKVCEIFVYKHTETIECVKKGAYFLRKIQD